MYWCFNIIMVYQMINAGRIVPPYLCLQKYEQREHPGKLIYQIIPHNVLHVGHRYTGNKLCLVLDLNDRRMCIGVLFSYSCIYISLIGHKNL